VLLLIIVFYCFYMFSFHPNSSFACTSLILSPSTANRNFKPKRSLRNFYVTIIMHSSLENCSIIQKNKISD
jgi:hypothetical protein